MYFLFYFLWETFSSWEVIFYKPHILTMTYIEKPSVGFREQSSGCSFVALFANFITFIRIQTDDFKHCRHKRTHLNLVLEMVAENQLLCVILKPPVSVALVHEWECVEQIFVNRSFVNLSRFKPWGNNLKYQVCFVLGSKI